MTDDIHLKSDQAARLRAALRSRNEHLSDEDFVNRAFDDVNPDDRARIDAHVSSCAACEQELARTRAIAAQMNTEERKEQVDRLWSGFLDAAGKNRLVSLLRALRTIVLPLPQLATRGGPLPTRGVQAGRPATSRVLAEGATVDGRLTWRFTDGEAGGLKGQIVCSDAESLRGASVWLNTDPPRALDLADVGGEQRAEFVISTEEWRRLSRGPIVSKIISRNGEVITSDE